ncbi:organic hydroperoxide resistance protein [Marinibactrum halimedae]|uniref:Organic hydroperoxide resistance protein n=1 Tax=Marinibactrum halimedae TaxID=1444977 RepID=A0AA37T0N1_9GAMM|nr:organic hydroperoxide resistance protein [Marinibactrum halimedae]MCD9459058.1 organic hydroperoxide resistance protein [Marinibactrum halimedae]GLS24659.1 organic hydroperoxide resistance protein [Marinibactrum halimedae]
METVYQAHAVATGGRDGRAVSSDEKLNVQLSTPKELGGAGGDGTNPEQLFAAGYAACFIGAMKFVGAQESIAVPQEVSINSAVGIGPNPKGVGFAITVSLEISLPGLEKDVAQGLIDKAHAVCPYSNATRGNVDVILTLA